MARTITTSLVAVVPEDQVPSMSNIVPPLMHVPSPTMETKVVTASVTRYIIINMLTQLSEESKVMDKDSIVKYVSWCHEGATLLYDGASHRLAVRVGYKTPMLSEKDDNLFAVFKAIVGEFSPKEEELNETYPLKKENICLTKTKCMTSCIMTEAQPSKSRRCYGTMQCCISPRTSAAASYMNSLISSVVHKTATRPPPRESVPCPSAVARNSHNLV
jgi:hypothetical protein